MRAHVIAAAALVALTACDQSPDTVFRFTVDPDFYEAPGLDSLEREFRREAPFFVDMSDPATLSDEAKARLDLQAAWMTDHPSARFLVVAIGRAEDGRIPQDDPAHTRAGSVATYLAAAGIEPARLRVRVVPAGFGDTPYDPYLRVTTMVEDGWSTRREIMAALAPDAAPMSAGAEEGVQGAGDVGDPASANGGPSVPDGGPDGPAAGGPSTGPADDTPGTGGGTTSQDPVGGGTTSTGPTSGEPSAPGGGTTDGPAPSTPKPSGHDKNADKRDANSGRGNGDEAGDPGNSGGHNKGGDEAV